jgi:O-antigen ligase
MSRSATAVVLWAILNGFTLLYFAWMRWGAKWRGPGMLAAAILTAVLAVAILVSSIFVMMGKNIKLTGRVPLWTNLLENVVSEKPWFGYGLETVWYFPEFQKWAAVSSGWGTRIIVINGHNGYMDILIYLGVFGLILLCLFLWQGLAVAARRAFNHRTWLDFSPLLIFIYFLVVNLSVDFMVEFESFHWVIMVALLFLPPGRLAGEQMTAIGNDSRSG